MSVLNAAPSMRWSRWMGRLLSMFLLLFCPVYAGAQQDLRFDAAARGAPRFAPTVFPEVPATVAASLQEEGCSVPQYRYEGDSLANNLIQGSFAVAGQRDFAALCSRGERTSLLILWGGPARCPARVKEAADVDALIGAGDELLYSRRIENVGPEQVDDYARLVGVPLGRVTHDGIRHSVGEYQTSVLYCRAGEWVEIEPETTT